MFEREFEKMLLQYQDLVLDKKRFTGLIKDIFPEETRTVNLLMMAYDIGIVEEIQTVNLINNIFAFKYVKKLIDDYGISRKNADWIVSIWCACYGEKVLGKKSEIKVQDSDGPAISSDDKTVKSNSKKIYNDNFAFSAPQNGSVGVIGFSGAQTSTVILPNRYENYDVNHIQYGAFADTDIEEVIMTEGYKEIGVEVFAGCKKLHQVIIPYSVKSIAMMAFHGCCNLKNINLPEALTDIGPSAFEESGLKNISFPKSVINVSSAAFRGCKELDNVVIPKNIKSISQAMFMQCSSLRKVTLHDELEEIQDEAFKGCESLDYIIIPDSVKYIGEEAFEGVDKQFIVQCSFGSYAEEYCRKNRIKYQLV